jgi:hypothetical protein
MFATHTNWTESTCYYAAASHGNHYRLLAGPYRTEAEATAVLPFVQDWAMNASRDPAAPSYRYTVFTSYDGHSHSILGELKPLKPGGLTCFNSYEIGPCRRFREDGQRDRFYYEACAPDEADVWTLYGHIPGRGVDAIGDFETREHAEEVFARITGQRYGK